MEHDEVDFDEAFYLHQYPDVAAAGVDPYQHFLDFGISEGRLGARPTLRWFQGEQPFDASRETVLVVSHEASVTGAPILSLNLVRDLQRKYNVVSLLLGGGPLVVDFRESCVASIEPRARRHHAELASETVVQLAALYHFRFAIVNSVECALVLAPLARVGVPTIALIHEFAAYTRPGLLFTAAFTWASEVVFSTRVTYDDVVSHWPELSGRRCHFLPQGRCTLLTHALESDRQAIEMDRIQKALRPAGQAKDTLVVVGIGSVQMRKGVDLFIDCAARVTRLAIEKKFRFVWVGDGLDQDSDIEYSVFLTDQIQRSGLADSFEFMATTPLVEEVYRQADIFLLTSRLDPFPGVALEAMSHRLPVICFAGTTGIADMLAANGMSEDCVASYLDTTHMAAKVVEIANSQKQRARVGESLERIEALHFDMVVYVDRLEQLALLATRQLDGLQRN